MTTETRENAMPDFQRRPSGLVRGEEGQITVIFALLSMSLVFFWMSVYQTGEVVADKIKVQDTADACAYSGAVWGARLLNLICYTNRAIIANIVSMTEIVIARSHSKFWLDIAVILELITKALSWIPIIGPILQAIGIAIAAIATIYESLTYLLSQIAIRAPTNLVQTKIELWFIFLHNLCALENSIHWMLAPPPIGGVYVDTGAISSAINTAVIPMAIQKTSEMIDPMPGAGQSGDGRIWVNPAFADAPGAIQGISQVFRQTTLQTYHDLLAWPGGKHGVERGNRRGEYEPGTRTDGTLCAYNKMIDQKWRLKWLIEKTAERRLGGLWSWKRGGAGNGLMSHLSRLQIPGIVRLSISGETRVDEYKDGMIKSKNFMGGKVFVRIAAPEQLQNDRDIEATDYLSVEYYKWPWYLFAGKWKPLFQAGEMALLSEDTDPLFGTISPTFGNYYNQRKNNDKYRKTAYMGLPHEDNRNHKYDIFLGPLPNPQDHFPTLAFYETKDNKAVWRPSGIHELNNDVFQQNSRNWGERAVWKSGGGPAGFRARAWMASNLPSYCYVLDGRRRPTAGGGSNSRRFFIPKEKARNTVNEQLGKRCGAVLTVAYKSAKGLKIVEIMGQGMDDAPAADVTYKQQARTAANMDRGETLTSRPAQNQWQEKKVNLDMIRGGKFNAIGMSGLCAFAAAETYYENPGDAQEPPNDMNPCWRARLAPMDRYFVAMLDGGTNDIQKAAMNLLRPVVEGNVTLMKQGWKLLGGRENDIDMTTLMTH